MYISGYSYFGIEIRWNSTINKRRAFNNLNG